MDQVRTALNWLKQQHFWVLSVVIALIGVFCWWSASRAMSATYDKNQSQIKSTFTSLDAVRKTPFHPNEEINKKQDAERQKQSESVNKLWQQLYDRQKAEVLQWPPELRKDFSDTVEKLEFNDDIPAELCTRYRDYIDRHFPELPKRINARLIEDTTAGGGGGFGRGGGGRFGEGEGGGFAPGTVPDDSDYTCEWRDQNLVREQLNFSQQPSSLRIWVTQEDLWVYHTLLNVIAKTNQAANATRMSNAAVKIVYSLEVGRNAAHYSRQQNRLTIRPTTSTAAPGAEGESAPRPNMGPEGGAGARSMGGPPERGMGGSGSGPMSPADEQAFLLSGRYLDEKGLPIPVGAGAAAGALEAAPQPQAAADPNTPAPPLDPAIIGAGYKRLPVRMAMQMDVRWLPQLITACANEPLRVEIQEVRINPSDLTGAESGGGGSGFGGFGGGGERGFGGGGSQAGTNPFPDLTGVQNFPAQPHVANVVLQGTIYIFNKPNMKLLEQAPAATPVATTP